MAVTPNPAYPKSLEITPMIQSVEVPYVNMQGIRKSGIIEVHKSLVSDVETFFHTALELKFPIEDISVSSNFDWDDTLLTSANITSGFNYRPIAGTERLSLHSYGAAFDVNPRLNPYFGFTTTEFVVPEGATYDPKRPGTLTASHPLVTLLKAQGWEWGGDWTRESGRIDYQHFQKHLPGTTDRVQ